MTHSFPSQNLPWSRCRAFSLTETLIVVALVSIVMALIVPSAQSVLQKARAAQCQGNLRQIGAALALYQADNNNSLPKVYDTASGYYWFHQLLGLTPGGQGANYLSSAKVLACPSNPKKATTYLTTPPTVVGFGMYDPIIWTPSSHRSQDEARLPMKILKPSDWPLVMDADKLAIYSLDNPTAEAAGDARYAARHNNRANVLMADGHIEQAAYGEKRWTQSVLNSPAYIGR